MNTLLSGIKSPSIIRMPSYLEKKQSVEPTETRLRREFLLLQVQFADTKWKASKASPESFFQVLREQTWVITNIEQTLTDNPSFSVKDRSDLLAQLEHFINQVHAERKTGWEERIIRTFGHVKKYWRRPDAAQKPPETIGIWSWNIVPPRNDLEAYGISSQDLLLELHVQTLQRGKNVGLDAHAIRDQLSQVADVLVERYPEVKAVIGISWLMDRLLAKQLGFTIASEIEVPQNTLSAWSQLITKDGTLDKRRVNQTLLTGKLPFKARLGLIPMKDFLQRYPPKKK
jgi:hypothetical protein